MSWVHQQLRVCLDITSHSLLPLVLVSTFLGLTLVPLLGYYIYDR